jgi:hypothetical protein
VDEYQERKNARTEYYKKFVEGWKKRKCTACNGSGRYDHNGSSSCGACNGTGKEKYKPMLNLLELSPEQQDQLIDFLHKEFGTISACCFGFTDKDIKIMYQKKADWKKNREVKEVEFEGQTIPVEVRFCGPIRLCNT